MVLLKDLKDLMDTMDLMALATMAEVIHHHLMLTSLHLARLAPTPLLRPLQSLTTILILVMQEPLTMDMGLTTVLITMRSMLAGAVADAVPVAATTTTLAAAHTHSPST